MQGKMTSGDSAPSAPAAAASSEEANSSDAAAPHEDNCTNSEAAVEGSPQQDTQVPIASQVVATEQDEDKVPAVDFDTGGSCFPYPGSPTSARI